MRKYITGIMSIIFAFTLCFAVGLSLNKVQNKVEAASSNLIVNGDFEDPQSGNAAFELNWGAELYTAKYAGDPNVLSGGKSIKIPATTTGGFKPLAKNFTLENTPGLKLGKEYELSFYYRATDGLRGYTYEYVYYNTDQSARVDNQDIHFANNDSNVENVWEKLTYKFTLNSTYGQGTAVTGFRFVFGMYGQVIADGNLYIDNLTLTEVTDEKNLIKGGDFESDPSNNGFLIGYGASWYHPTNVDSKIYSGAGSMKIDCINSHGATSVFIDLGNDFAYNKDYQFRMKYYCTDGYRGYVFTRIYAGNNRATLLTAEDAIHAIANNATGIENQWVEVSFTISITDETIKQLEFVLAYGELVNSGNIYIDDLSLSKVADEPVPATGTYTDLTINVDNGTVGNMAYGYDYVAPVASATAKLDGSLVDVSEFIKVTYKSGETVLKTGYQSEESRKLLINFSGYATVEYSVDLGNDVRSTVTKNLGVTDTLQSIEVDTTNVTLSINQGEEIDLTNLVVNETRHYSGKKATTTYTVDNNGLSKLSVAGTYTIYVVKGEQYPGRYILVSTPISVTVGESGNVDQSTCSISIAEQSPFTVGYNQEITLPDVVITAKDQSGATVTNPKDYVKMTIYYGGKDTDPVVDGCNDVALGDRKFTITNHGYYLVKYTYTNGSCVASCTFALNVIDTLNGVTVDTSAVVTHVHSSDDLDLSKLVVTKGLSYSQSAVATNEEYTIEYGTYAKGCEPGTYTITVKVEQDTDFGKITKTTTFDVTVYADGQVIDLSTCSISIAEQSPFTVGYNQEITLPDVVVVAKDQAGATVTNAKDFVKMTIYHGYDDTYPVVEGFNNVALGDRKFIVPDHGYYVVKYTYTNGSCVASCTFALNVIDTLNGVTVDISAIVTHVHSSDDLDLSKLVVTKGLSYSQSAVATNEEYTIEYGTYAKGCEPGTYTITVKVEQDTDFGKITKTANFDITVYADGADIDLSVCSISIAEGSVLRPGYNQEITLPDVVVTAKDHDGEIVTNAKDYVKMTIYLGENDSADILDGYDNVALGERKVTITRHGYYYVKYTYTNGNCVANCGYILWTLDTLTDVIVNTSGVQTQIHSNDNLDLSELVVIESLSYTGSATLTSDDYTIEYGTYAKGCEPGTYTITVKVEQDTDFGKITKTTTFDVTVYADGDVIDYSKVVISVDTTELAVGYGYDITIPRPTAEGTNMDGEKSDVSNLIGITLYTGSASDGWDYFADLSMDNLSFKIERHGWYLVEYYVTYSGKTDKKSIVLSVKDTLIDIEVNTDGFVGKIHKGEEVDFTNLIVYSNRSYTGKTVVAKENYIVDFGSLTSESGVGEYTLTIKVEDVYYNTTITKTKEIKVNVVPDTEDIDYSSVIILSDTSYEDISFRLEYNVCEVEVIAKNKDGQPVDISSDLKLTLYIWSNNYWSEVGGYVGVSATNFKFTPDNHGYYKIIFFIDYNNKHAELEHPLNIMDTLQGISLGLKNVETSIHVGDDLDLSRLLVNKQMSYTGASVAVEGTYTINYGTFNKDVPGIYPIKITYSEQYGGTYEESFNVVVKDIVESTLLVKGPNQVEYAYGEPINLTGLVVNVVLRNLGEVQAEITDIEVKGYSARKVGKQTVKLYYDGELVGQIEVTVLDSFYAVVIDTESVKTQFAYKDDFNSNELVVYKVMVSGNRTQLSSSDYTIDMGDFDSKTPGTYTITIKVRVDGVTKTAEYDVEVLEKQGCGSNINGLAYMLMLACLVVFVGVKKLKY